MIINEINAKKAYAMLGRFIDFVNNKNRDALSSDFGVSEDVCEEIFDALSGYLDGESIWSLPPGTVAFNIESPSRDFDFYEMNQAGVWGSECRLWENGKRSEPIVHAEFTEVNGTMVMDFRYIEN
ncbi:hypothetical protein LL318_02720 [Serratia ureilytica]|nr:hypothetical protein [Serratia ureilytica]